jgi:hypothetical protein
MLVVVELLLEYSQLAKKSKGEGRLLYCGLHPLGWSQRLVEEVALFGWGKSVGGKSVKHTVRMSVQSWPVVIMLAVTEYAP